MHKHTSQVYSVLTHTTPHDFKHCLLEKNENIVRSTIWKSLTLHYANEYRTESYITFKVKNSWSSGLLYTVGNECGAPLRPTLTMNTILLKHEKRIERDIIYIFWDKIALKCILN